MAITRSLRNLRRWWDFPRRHNIPPDAVVLDVGCGNWPNMRANILADKFLVDDSERGQPLALDHRPLIVCDALYLPFKDKSVDYVICSHLAEHVEDPEALFRELSRVAGAGYVECPGRIWEMLHGWEYHRWYVTTQGGEMLFEEKPRPLHDSEMHAWYDNLFKNDREFEQFFIDNIERLGMVSMYDWVGEARCSVRRLPQSVWERTTSRLESRGPVSREELATQLGRVPTPPLSRNESIKKRLAARARRASDGRALGRLRSMLCCPRCKGELTDGKEGLSCAACRADFPVVGNIYYLVPEQIAGWRPESLTDVVHAH
ncbi:MAG TPA: methyltransferase domain-containing protein [Pyrinomonadaceae bacterium]|nr:methyltransferase domain-containing protein [Pyrinomonadaceae bacterium]